MMKPSVRSRRADRLCTLCLLLGICFSLAPVASRAEDSSEPTRRSGRVTVDAGMDLVSSYIWRGIYLGGPSFQPSVTMRAGNFTLGAWASVDFVASSYKEVDLQVRYQWKGLTFQVSDLYDEGSTSNRDVLTSRNYFHFGADSPHRVEAGVAWQVSRKVPVTLSWYTILFGASDVDTEGRRCYSSYAEVSYPFAVKTIEMRAGVGVAPWKTAGVNGAKGFAVKNVFLTAGRDWSFRNMGSFRLGLFTQLAWCPFKEDVNLVGGVSLRM